MLTVDAVIVRKGRGKKPEILLIKTKNEPFSGCWALPGGYMEEREDIKTAVVREAGEETGLTVDPVRMVGVYDGTSRDKRGNISVVWLCDIVKGKEKAGSDASDLAFFDIGKIPPNLAFDHGKIIEDSSRMLGKRSVRVLAGGVFNIIHPGHVHFLEKAKKLGDELVVVVASDRTALKSNKKLIFPADIRAKMVRNLKFVDKVVIGDESDMMKVVKEEEPEVIALGYDQSEEEITKMLRDAGISPMIVKIGELKGYSTKKITGG